MKIVMLERARVDLPDGRSVVYRSGGRYTVAEATGRDLIGRGKAIEVEAATRAPAPDRDSSGE